MGFTELFLIAVGLSMDAFAVCICKGLNMKEVNYRSALLMAVFFGGFQALMPLIGWLTGSRFQRYITDYDHWIAFLLLGIIGGKMILDALKPDSGKDNINKSDCKTEMENSNGIITIKELFALAVATSIDALAVGITFALLPDINIWVSITTIGVTTFVLSALGVVAGNRIGNKYEKKAELAGGIILVLIGLKILLEHLIFY
ncbi:MAG: manganese efflux pump MntP family protein [Oscillospiraceae bacterium]|nr:manganese efflux pump MntP family protein [Oscillospiraceae bacterium]